MRKKPTLKFYLKTGSDPARGTVYFRVTYERQKAELSTGLLVETMNWDETAERVRKGKEVNNKLATLEHEIETIVDKLYFNNKPLSARIIVDVYTGKAAVDQFLLSYFEGYIRHLESLPRKEIAKTTLTKYKSSFKHLKGFVTSHQQKDIALKQVDYKLICELDHYLITHQNYRTGGTLERNTVNKVHTQLKAVLGRAFKENLIERNPYGQFPLSYTKTKRDFLTDEELQRLKEHLLGNNVSLQRVRDIYLFSVYTGLRFSDASQLKLKNIHKELDGTYWIDTTQEKTGELVRIPMLRPALEIVAKYDNAERASTGYILPRISHQKVNAFLKTIATLVGIDKNLTHHTARHSFATTITLSNEVPIEVVSKMLGHTNVRTTQIYAKITNQYMKAMAEKLNEKLK